MRPITVNMIPGGVTPVINVSQYDNNYDVPILLIEGTETYTPPTGATIRVEGTKPDGLGFEFPCTYQGNSVSVPIQTQMTVVKGRFPIELVVRQGDYRLGSCNLILAVEKAPLGEGTDTSESVLPDIIAGAQAQADAAAASATEAAGYRDEAEEHKDDAAGSATEASGYKDLAAQSANRAAEIAADLATSAAVPNALFNKEASGNPIIIDDGVDDIPVRELITKFGPIQDLNGYSKPWPGGGGKNLIRNIKVQGNASTVTLGQSVATGRETYLPAGTWTFSYTSAKTCSIYYRDEAADAAARNIKWVDNAKSGTITLTEGTFIRVWAFLSSGISADEIESFQIEAGSTATDYEPYSNICPIEGRTGLTVTHANKNLMPNMAGTATNTTNGITYTYNDDGSFTINGTATANAYSRAVDGVATNIYLPHGTYKKPTMQNGNVGVYVQYMRSASNWTTVTGGGTLSQTFVIDEDYPLAIRVAVMNGTTVNNVRFEPYIYSESETDLTWETPVKTTVPVSWESEAGVVYGGTLNLTTGKLTVDKGYASFDGSENWNWQDGGTYKRVACPLSDVYNPGGRVSVQSNAGTFRASGNDVGTIFTSGTTLFYYPEASITSLADYKTWLASNNLQIVYLLATPIVYQLTPEELKTLKGFNQIYSDGDSNSVKYLADAEESVSDVVADRWAIKNEVSGDIAAFSDAADDVPMKSVVAEITPVQNLNGQANPYPPGGGKNLLPPNATDETKTINGITVKAQNGVYTVSGTASAYTDISFSLTDSVNLNPSENKIAFLNTVSSGTTQCAFARNGTVIHYWALGSVNRIASGWTDSGDEVVNEIRIQVQSGTTVNMTLSPMLIKTEEANPTVFSPYSNICPISGRTGMTVTRAGKNLFDGVFSQQNPNQIQSSTITLPTGTYTYSQKYNGTPTWGVYVQRLDNTEIARVYNANKVTFTLSQEESVTIRVYYGNGITPANITEAQIEIGSTATPYTPYVASTTYPITWQTEAGTVYGGTLDVVSGVLTVDRACYTAADFPSHAKSSSTSFDEYFFRINADQTPEVGTAANDDLICSHAIRGATSGANYVQCRFASNQPRILFPVGTMSTISDFDTWLADQVSAGTPLQFSYVLATPQTYQLTPKEVKSFLGDNTVYSDAGKVTVKYVADTKLYIDNKIAELQALILDNI